MNHMHVTVVQALFTLTASVRTYLECVLPLLSGWVNTEELTWCLVCKRRIEEKENLCTCVCVCVCTTGFTPWRGIGAVWGVTRGDEDILLIEWRPGCWYFLVPPTLYHKRQVTPVFLFQLLPVKNKAGLFWWFHVSVVVAFYGRFQAGR